MVLAGGYASSPSNDVWVTEDGKQWMLDRKTFHSSAS
jgi:hypothetical protein